jgi:hypothetical protein
VASVQGRDSIAYWNDVEPVTIILDRGNLCHDRDTGQAGGLSSLGTPY